MDPIHTQSLESEKRLSWAHLAREGMEVEDISARAVHAKERKSIPGSSLHRNECVPLRTTAHFQLGRLMVRQREDIERRKPLVEE
jgi:hypothetical protein